MVEAFRKYWHGDQGELHLLLDLRDGEAPRRERIAAVGAVAAQAVIIAVLFNAPMTPGRSGRFFPEVRLEMGQATPVFVPRDVIDNFQLTQKAPQTAAPAAEVNVEQLLPRTGRETSPAPGPPALAGPAPSASPKPFTPPEPARQERASLEPPPLEIEQRGVTPAPSGPAPALPPPPASQPKLAFEPVGPPPGKSTGAPVGQPRLTPPSSRPEDVAREAARARGRVTVGDADVTGAGGIGEMSRQTPAPGSPGSALELLSDPQGVDFKPYLLQVLARVRRNWMAVMPESARFGQRGRTVVQFSIDRNGRIPRVGIVLPSGTPGLDRAAVAGLTASVPLPPLPPEFRGGEIRLQFVFSYNMPAR